MNRLRFLKPILILLIGAGLPLGCNTAKRTAVTTGEGWPTLGLERIGEGLSLPVHLTHAGDGSGRLFVVEQEGRIRILGPAGLSNSPFLDIAGRVGCCGEQGLLSVAFPPGYTDKKYFYVNYTDAAGDTVVARYRVTENPDTADPATEEILLTVDQPYSNHNGGLLIFGPDGYLYIGMGDGGSAGDPQNNGQNPAALLGKLLRMDVESGPAPYVVPSTNPFVQTAGYRGEIWAMGLRNPWRFSFDRQTGDLYIADVGQNDYEEINFQPAVSLGGENYGWRIMEGSHCFDPDPCSTAGLTLPAFEYSHSEGCTVIGGMVYRGKRYPNLSGLYFYGDYCEGWIGGAKRSGTAWQTMQLYKTGFPISSFGEDEEGELYVSDYQNGAIHRLIDASAATAVPQPRHRN
jgi:glucose/arabinose dehydrogenase